eukprot:4573733-Ditylum_brightwellii.AAC.1
MESQRAESIGLLLILCFITHYDNCHKIQVKDEQWIHYCDNMSKVKRIKWMNVGTVLTPSASIRADMDVHFQ